MSEPQREEDKHPRWGSPWGWAGSSVPSPPASWDSGRSVEDIDTISVTEVVWTGFSFPEPWFFLWKCCGALGKSEPFFENGFTTSVTRLNLGPC